METNPTLVLKIMHGVFWVLFIGLCIETGAVLVSFFVSEFISPAAARDLYQGLDLSALRSVSEVHYGAVVSLEVYFLATKAYLAYLVIRIFQKIDFAAPFSLPVAALITKISRVALSAGIVALATSNYTKWLAKRVVAEVPTWSYGEFLFLAGIIFVIAQVFQKGTDLQAENALTV
ncbi:DUF2975 domain-containing protein [Hymenobacter latericus]|uniref:DUF2975 domain-containing protein n=1 Tax=Hymenobacter sp. YIM 151858-1 TaxID=2987688 RepID=UPI002227A95E|nr:DUF2975 domain-containing protein [Hymenobacter sp. YIM 151858-1]UYZ59026.1 DUF2975 domain-containing protein [Hymenobacter sp. YIM 151858-1]